MLATKTNFSLHPSDEGQERLSDFRSFWNIHIALRIFQGIYFKNSECYNMGS
jgi:hypothetical protein